MAKSKKVKQDSKPSAGSVVRAKTKVVQMNGFSKKKMEEIYERILSRTMS